MGSKKYSPFLTAAFLAVGVGACSERATPKLEGIAADQGAALQRIAAEPGKAIYALYDATSKMASLVLKPEQVEGPFYSQRPLIPLSIQGEKAQAYLNDLVSKALDGASSLKEGIALLRLKEFSRGAYELDVRKPEQVKQLAGLTCTFATTREPLHVSVMGHNFELPWGPYSFSGTCEAPTDSLALK